MTVSTADLGGLGNGLGLPIANPLYGPGNAASMGQQAFNQTMQNAQAQTQETQARTQRDIQTLPFDIKNIQARTSETQQATKSKQLENDAYEVLGPQQRAAGMQADIMSKESEAAQKQHDFLQRQIISNASILDNQSPEQSQQQLEMWGKQAGLQPGEASTLYGGLAGKYGQTMTAGPGGTQTVGGYQGLRQQLLEANPDIFKTRIQEQGAMGRAQLQSQTELKATQMKLQQEDIMLNERLRNEPQSAPQYLINRYYDLKKDDLALAQQFLERGLNALQNTAYVALAQGYGRTMAQPSLPGLGIPSVANLQPGQVPQPPVPGQAVPAVPPSPQIDSQAKPAPGTPQAITPEGAAAFKQYGPPKPGTTYVKNSRGQLGVVSLSDLPDLLQKGYIQVR